MSPIPRAADVTVVIPAFRAESTIGRALASVAAQTVKPRRVVVVDDGSDDATRDVAQDFADRLDGIALTVLGQENAGPGAARNRGIAEAGTSLVAFLDADDEWLPEKLAVSVAYFDDEAICFVSHNYVRVEDGRETVVDCTRHLRGDVDPYLALFRGNFIDTSSVVARRDAVLAAGGFDETLPSAQDYALWLAMAAKPGAHPVVFGRALSRYHIVPGSISSGVERRRECALRILDGQLHRLRLRSSFPLAATWRRAALIARETVQLHAASGRPFAAISAILRLPLDLIRVSLRLMRARGEPFTVSRAAVAATTDDPRTRNRAWWERMPMIYADWDTSARAPASRREFVSIRRRIFETSPFFREQFDMTELAGLGLLDLGCGSGAFSCMLAEAGARVTAVDITEAAVKLTRSSAQAFGLPIGVARMDAENMAIADATFDFVFSWGVLHHTPDPERAFGEVARLLKPGGKGLIMVYHKTSAIYYLNGLYWLLAKGKLFRGHGLESVQGFYTDGYYHRHYTRGEYRRSLGQAGLTVDRIFVTEMEKKILPAIPAGLDRWLKQRFGWLVVAEISRGR